MLGKATIALLAAPLWSIVVSQPASACYGIAPAFEPCGEVVVAPYPFQHFYRAVPYTGFPGYAYAGFVVGCYPIRRPVLGLYGWQTRTVQVCE
jgi:hypothetical protein